jgi:hypothetical protein
MLTINLALSNRFHRQKTASTAVSVLGLKPSRVFCAVGSLDFFSLIQDHWQAVRLRYQT